MIEKVTNLENLLPEDARRRPYNDEWILICLADIFECAGGAASVYWSEHSGAMARTPFRMFVQALYEMLPIEPEQKRTQKGLDEAIRDAMRSRRSRTNKG